MEHAVKCPECSEPSLASDRDFGRTVRCGACGACFYLPKEPEFVGAKPIDAQPVHRFSPPPLTNHVGRPRFGEYREARKSQRNGPLFAGAICLLVGCGTMMVSPLFPFVYSWPLLAAFVLSIIAITQGETRGGVSVLLASVCAPAVILTVQVLIVFGSVAALLDGVAKKSSTPWPVARSALNPQATRLAPVQRPVASTRRSPQVVAPPRIAPINLTGSRSRPAAPVAKSAVSRAHGAESYIEANGKRVYASEVRLGGAPARSLGSMLDELEQAAKPFSQAVTTVAKQKARRDVIDAASALFNSGRQVFLDGKIKDVGSGKDGRYVLALSDCAGFEWQRGKSRVMPLIGSCAFSVMMSAEEAQRLRPSTPVGITARVRFRENVSAFSGMATGRTMPSFGLGLGGSTTLGYIDFTEYVCRVEGKDYPSGPAVSGR